MISKPQQSSANGTDYVKFSILTGNDLKTFLLQYSAFHCVFPFLPLASPVLAIALFISHSMPFLPFYSFIPEIFFNLGIALGNGLYRGGRIGGHGGKRGGSSFGRAGGHAVRGLATVLNNIKQYGLVSSLGIDRLPDTQKPKTPHDFKELLLHEIIGDNDSTMDDAAATYAMDKVLNDILSDCKDGQEIEDKLQNATDDDLHEWIITFEIEYILEYSAELFQSHIFDKGSNPEEIKKDMRGWLHNELDEKLSKELTQIDFNSREGKEYLDSLTSEILDIWKQE